MPIASEFESRFLVSYFVAARWLERGEMGTVVETSGITGCCVAAPAVCSVGKSLPAFCQSVHPSRHTSESLLTRPSEIHLRMMSPRAGPYWPPVGGRTYQMADGASAMGSSATAVPTADCGAGATATPGAAGAGATACAATAPEPLLFACSPCAASLSSRSLSRPGSLTVGMRTLVPHLGQTPFLPARNDLTFNLCPLGQ